MKRLSPVVLALLLAVSLQNRLQAQVPISGPLSGVLEDTTYLVMDSIYVQITDSLVILPGAKLLFGGWFNFRIYGYLSALGTQQDSIYFQPVAVGDSLKSIIFQGGASDSCAMAYCYISGCTGSAINAYYVAVTISNCTITGNRASWGGGIYLSSSNGAISECVITNNVCGNNGGGIYCTASSPTITDCIVSGNLCDTQPTTSSGMGGGGICANHGSSPIISGCTISDNHSLWHGGGISINDNSEVNISHCLIADNSCDSSGGGIAIFNYCEPTITNCTLSGDSAAFFGGGIYLYYSSPTIQNTIVEGCGGNGVIYFDLSPTTVVQYNDFYNPLAQTFMGIGPTNLGVIDTVNANGDSCDTYCNIYFDPLFVNPGAGDYHLQMESPCIDAGDPTWALDPDGTIADIGAFYYDQIGFVANGNETPAAFAIVGPYPNPFNAETRIQFQLPVAGWVKLEVFDISGRSVRAHSHAPLHMKAGIHNVTFDGSGLPSGIYLYRLEAGEFTASGKMVLLK